MPAKKKSTGGIVGVDAARAAELKKKRTFRVFNFRGLSIDDLVAMKHEDMVKLLNCRQRRVFARKLGKKEKALVNRLRAAKKDVAFGEKPPPVKTHLRGMIVIPEMIGSVVAIHMGAVRADDCVCRLILCRSVSTW
eukprot:TRINITY_DN984_c0_g1_i1.p3 TRINITY_DN984_c0_g1~~TRINITY_DN984_c0_g1_i1.p3  ORF type:complete len:136 (-),score=35.80 TRINITY_DN984_c0_g1_i1:620-1027(-)